MSLDRSFDELGVCHVRKQLIHNDVSDGDPALIERMLVVDPAADGLLLCCERLGVDPENSVYVGDSPTDGQAARAAGMKSIGVLWGAGEEAALGTSFDVVVPDVPELIVALRDTFAPVAEDAH